MSNRRREASLDQTKTSPLKPTEKPIRPSLTPKEEGRQSEPPLFGDYGASNALGQALRDNNFPRAAKMLVHIADDWIGAEGLFALAKNAVEVYQRGSRDGWKKPTVADIRKNVVGVVSENVATMVHQRLLPLVGPIIASVVRRLVKEAVSKAFDKALGTTAENPR